MRREVAGCVLAVWIVVAAFLVTACGQSGAVKQAVSSFTASSTTAGAPAPAAAGTSNPAPAATGTSNPAQVTTGSPAASSATSGWFWLWVALAVLIVAILTAWFIHVRRRHAAIAADWRTRLINAYAKGSALHDAMAVAETPEVFGAPDASIRWADIQRRAEDFGQVIYSLRESAHDDQERTAFAAVLASLGSVLSAMAAERSVGGTNALMVGVVWDRLSTFGLSLHSLRGQRARTDQLGWPES